MKMSMLNMMISNKILEKNENRNRPIIKFLDEIENVAKGFVCKNGMLNPYFNENFGKRLINLSEYFVLYTAVMPRLYDDKHTQQYQEIYTATSARSESYFKTLKNNILDSKNKRVEKVVIKHLRTLSGTVKLQAAEQESIRYNKKAQNILFNEELSTIEDSCIGLPETNEYSVQEDNSSTSRERNINHTESPSKNSFYNSQKHTENVQLSNTKKNSSTHIFQDVKPIFVPNIGKILFN